MVDREKTPWLIVMFHTSPYNNYVVHFKVRGGKSGGRGEGCRVAARLHACAAAGQCCCCAGVAGWSLLVVVMHVWRGAGAARPLHLPSWHSNPLW